LKVFAKEGLCLWVTD